MIFLRLLDRKLFSCKIIFKQKTLSIHFSFTAVHKNG
jgi:hypothetical protein